MKEFKGMPNLREETVENPDEILISDSPIWIEFDYPFTKSTVLQYFHPGGFTRQILFNTIKVGYKLLFETELAENAIHGYGDLFLEGFDFNPETHILSLSMGS